MITQWLVAVIFIGIGVAAVFLDFKREEYKERYRIDK